MRRIGFLIPASLLASCALVSQLFSPEPPEQLSPSVPEGLTDAAVRFPGVESMVAGIALQDRIQWEIAETAKLGGLAPDGGVLEPDDGGTDVGDGGWLAIDAAMARCYQDPATYEVWVDFDAARHRWKVILMPIGKCAEGVYDGDSEYEIDASSYEILKRVLEH